MSSLSGEDDTHASKEDNADDNTSDKPLKGGKPRGPEHEHFVYVEMVNNRPKLKCKYCSQEIMRHAERMRSHLASKCTEVPIDVRKKFEGTVKSRSEGKNLRTNVHETSGNGLPAKRSKLSDFNLADLTCSSADDDDDDDELSPPMKILNTVFKSLSRAGNVDGPTASSSKKSIKQMTDAEVDRELKEMQVKKIRTEIQMMEEQMQLYNSVGYKLGKLIRTMDEFFKSKANEPKELKLVD